MRNVRFVAIISALILASLSSAMGVEPRPGANSDASAAAQQPPRLATVDEARRQAELLHRAMHATLQVVHHVYYREDEGLAIPAAGRNLFVLVPAARREKVVTVGDQWVCKVCWKLNRPRDEVCWRCKAPRGTTEEGEVAKHREVMEAKAAAPEPVPDIVVALPVSIFRGYGKAWVRGGFVTFGLLALMAFGGVTDFGYLAVTGAFGVGLIVCGLLADRTRRTEADVPDSTCSVTDLSSMVIDGPSSSVIVPMPWPSLMVTFVGLPRLRKNVSLISSIVSPCARTWIVFCVSPGLKVSAPLVAL